MKINGKVHCFFEQSGTFKNEFKKLGIPAFDYDLQNNFGETDHQIDLFAEIEQAYGILVLELRAYARNDLAKTKGKKASEQLQKGRAGRNLQRRKKYDKPRLCTQFHLRFHIGKRTEWNTIKFFLI